MKRFGNPLLSMAAPFLILVSILSLLQRQGSDRLQAIPAFLVGTGLIISGALGRQSRRKKLLSALLKTNQSKNKQF